MKHKLMQPSLLSMYGSHRVLSPKGALPQGALNLSNEPRILNPYELSLDVESLMLDATSMRQIRESSSGDKARMSALVQEIVRERGKMHNSVTNSGGVLVGRIREVGSKFFDIHPPTPGGRAIGDVIVPVASLSTLPLHLKSIKDIRGDRVLVEGTAIMFACMRICPIPPDFSQELALACVDISSLVPQVNRCLRSLADDRQSNRPIRVLIMGAGKAGLAALYCIRDFEKASQSSKAMFEILAVDFQDERVANLKRLGLAESCAKVDARDASALHAFVFKHTKGELCDLVINVVNVPSTETPTVLCARAADPRGMIFWFSMATRFDQAALATDSLGKDVTMLIGNGVADQQVEETVSLLRSYPELRRYFESR